MITIYPLTNKAVLSTSLYIDWEGVKLLLDIGPGSTLKMFDQRVPLSRIDLILISHSHIDHFWDIVPFLWFRTIKGSQRKIAIMGPDSERPLFDWLIEVSQGKDFCEFTGIKDGQRIHVKTLSVEAFNVQHESSKNALGFLITEKLKTHLNTDLLKTVGLPEQYWKKIAEKSSFTWRGKRIKPQQFIHNIQRKIVYTGDTKKIDALVEKAFNADLLIAEATFTVKPKCLEYSDFHMDVNEALEVAQRAHVKHVLLTHHSLRFSLSDFHEKINQFMAQNESSFKVSLGLDPLQIP